MRYKTWEDECLSRLVVVNPGGSVALCVLWYLIENIDINFKLYDQLGVVGNLRTPIGIGWFLRGLAKLNFLKKVVIWGPDLSRTGEALVNLWKKGLSSDHSIPGFGWRIDPSIPVEFVSELVGKVALENRVGESQNTLGLYSLNWTGDLLANRASQEFPPLAIEERQFWPSLGSNITLMAQNPGDAWIKVLNACIHSGRERVTRKGERISHLFDLKVFFPAPEVEEIYPCFNFSREDLDGYKRQFLSPIPPLGVDYGYGQRMQDWRGHNQLEEVITRLIKSPDTKRATIALLEAPDLEELEDAPCFTTATFSIIDDPAGKRLDGAFIFRSHDMYEGWPLNIYAILEMFRVVAKRLQLRLGFVSFTSQNAQIYDRHWNSAIEKVEKYGVNLGRPSDYLKVKSDPAGNFVFEITPERKIVCRYMSMQNDQIIWEVEHRDPRVLVSWIVSLMPWLSAQHIRYLGVEEEKLRRSLKTGELYIQG